MTLPLAEFTAFHGLGIALGVWAVVVATLGFMSADFPKNEGAARAVMAITALLVASTIGAAIITGEKHEGHGAEHEKAAPEHGGETP